MLDTRHLNLSLNQHTYQFQIKDLSFKKDATIALRVAQQRHYRRLTLDFSGR